MINLKRILVPTDFSDSANHALTYGISFAREYKAELILLHVVETLSVGYAGDLPKQQSKPAPSSSALLEDRLSQTRRLQKTYPA